MSKSKITDYFQPTDKQRQAMKLLGKGYRIFYGGARGGGKSHLALAAAVYCCRKYPGLRAIIMREYFPELEEVFISNLSSLYPEHAFKYTYKVQHKIASFQNGSRISFRSCDTAAAAKKIMGAEFQLMIIDEANNFDSLILQKLSGSLRNTKVADFIPTLLCTGNPGGVSDLYFRSRWVVPDYKRWSPGELKHKDKYVFIQSFVQDNPHVTHDYVENLETIADENLKAAWLHGRWDVFEGQFFTEFNTNIHVIKSSPLPPHWTRKGGLDLGYTEKHPTVLLLTAQDPETGDVHVYNEYANWGSTEQYVQEIKEIIQHEESRKCQVSTIYADPSMWDDSRKEKFDSDSPAFMFLREGIPIFMANNKRVTGWRVLKQWLHYTEHKPPKLLIHDNCVNLITTLPLNKYNTSTQISIEDLDTKGPDDAVDALRYVMVTGWRYPLGSVFDEAAGELSWEDDEPSKESQYQEWEDGFRRIGYDNMLIRPGENRITNKRARSSLSRAYYG